MLIYIISIMKGGKQYFHFDGETTALNHPLVVERCTHIKDPLNVNSRCRKRVEIGLDMCWIHLLKVKHLRIRNSTIRDGGLGLFAEDPTRSENAVIFKINDEICKYNGENIDYEEKNDRYGDNSGPYVMLLTGNDRDPVNQTFEDAALRRGIGSLINHTSRVSRQNAALRQRCNIATNHIPENYIRALKIIRNNREILTDYGNSYQLHEPNVRSGTNKNKFKFG
jgi:hypothetical protein